MNRETIVSNVDPTWTDLGYTPYVGGVAGTRVTTGITTVYLSDGTTDSGTRRAVITNDAVSLVIWDSPANEAVSDADVLMYPYTPSDKQAATTVLGLTPGATTSYEVQDYDGTVVLSGQSGVVNDRGNLRIVLDGLPVAEGGGAVYWIVGTDGVNEFEDRIEIPGNVTTKNPAIVATFEGTAAALIEFEGAGV